MQPLNLKTIAEFAGGTLRQGEPSSQITGITTDSRQERHGELFLAIRGKNFDGHRFVVDSVARGTLGAVVEHGFAVESVPQNYALIEVDDTLLAYQRIATKYRRTLDVKIIAITGSNGKTSTKDLTAAVLSRKYRVLKTEGNLNNHIGVPCTLLRASVEDEIIVLEMGMNHPGEIAPLARMASPDVAIITNIGTAHMEFMGSREGIAQEKGTLVEVIGSSGFVVLSSKDDFTPAMIARTAGHTILVGKGGDISAEEIDEELAGTRFTLIAGDERLRAFLPVPGRHMVTNALLAIAVGKIYGVSLAECVAALTEVRLTKGRMEWKNVHGFQILDDSYNANPDSVIVALETLSRMPKARHRIAIIGKMGELGSAAEEGYRRVADSVVRTGIDQLICVGAETDIMLRTARGAGLEQTFAVDSTEEAAHLLLMHANKDDLILIKGSRSAEMEKVMSTLERLLGTNEHATNTSTAVESSRAL